MDCKAFQKWLEEVPRFSPESIAGEPQEHSSSCPSCRAMLATLQSLRTGPDSARVPESRKMEMLSSILGKGSAAPTGEKARPQQPRAARSEPGSIFDFLKWGIAPLGLALGLVLVFLWKPWSGTGPAVAQIQVSGTRALYRDSSGKQTELARRPVFLAIPAPIQMLGSGSDFRVAFADGGSIDFRGEGTVSVDSTGFSADNGQFTAKFVKGKTPFKVKLPQAILGIRGTTVRFDLSSDEKTVELIEGVAELSPEGSTTGPITLLPRQLYKLSGNAVPSPKPVPTGSSTTPDFLKNLSPNSIDKALQKF